jgi:hypothetical protein
MEDVLTMRATPNWLETVKKTFPPNSIFKHNSKDDHFFGMDITEKDGKFAIVGNDVQGTILTKIFNSK